MVVVVGLITRIPTPGMPNPTLPNSEGVVDHVEEVGAGGAGAGALAGVGAMAGAELTLEGAEAAGAPHMGVRDVSPAIVVKMAVSF